MCSHLRGGQTGLWLVSSLPSSQRAAGVLCAQRCIVYLKKKKNQREHPLWQARSWTRSRGRRSASRWDIQNSSVASSTFSFFLIFFLSRLLLFVEPCDRHAQVQPRDPSVYEPDCAEKWQTVSGTKRFYWNWWNSQTTAGALTAASPVSKYINVGTFVIEIKWGADPNLICGYYSEASRYSDFDLSSCSLTGLLMLFVRLEKTAALHERVHPEACPSRLKLGDGLTLRG